MDELEAWLQLQTKQVQQNVEVIHRTETDGPLLHLSADGNIKNFTPRLEAKECERSVIIVHVAVAVRPQLRSSAWTNHGRDEVLLRDWVIIHCSAIPLFFQ